MNEDASKPARRFLHVCYCCADTAPVVGFFVDQLAMRNTMSTPVERSPGAILGIDGDIEGAAAFVYDARGPRTSPAIEVQSWIDPPLVGEPVQDVTAAGIQALGFAVPDIASTSSRLAGDGCRTVGRGTSPFGAPWVTLQDPRGVTLDLVEDVSMSAAPSRLRHLRISCIDLATSIAWYEGIGFETVGTASVTDAGFLGGAQNAVAECARLRLPDEGFEAFLVEWRTPSAHGRHVSEPYHAGLFRTAVAVDDTMASYQAMAAAGWTFDRAPMAVELHGTPVPDMWICFLSDPDGVPFELVERPRSAFAGGTKDDR